MGNLSKLIKTNKRLRQLILKATTVAGSGHPSSCLSAVELISSLCFGGPLRLDLNDPKNLANDRLIFSKGHAAPLLYSLFCVAGIISERELMDLRKFDSNLEGHPSLRCPLIDVATGSLGQGLSNGLGMALGIKANIDSGTLKIGRVPKVWVLLGDSEMAEGQVWEAMEIAAFHKLDNLVAIVDVNRLGQLNETMDGWDIQKIKAKVEAFGWNALIIEDGHDMREINETLAKISGLQGRGRPTMIIARTVKGKGISLIENDVNWHGKPLNHEQLENALQELGAIDLGLRMIVRKPGKFIVRKTVPEKKRVAIPTLREKVSTREAYGDALVALGNINSRVVVLDSEMANSTFSIKFKKSHPQRFFEMFIAEQNMISAGVGLSKERLIPFVSSFAAFLTRGFDQMRMAGYSKANLKIVGSHAGVSIGADGPSQMGLEDIGMAKSLTGSTVLCPSDAVSTIKLTEQMAKREGLMYMRTTRGDTQVIYEKNEEFPIGGCKIHNAKTGKPESRAVVISMGITLHEALKAQKELSKNNIAATVVDLYSVKPLDEKTIIGLLKKTKNLIVVEDHFPEAGIGESICKLLVKNRLVLENFVHLSVNKMPRSGRPDELLSFEKIDAEAIIGSVMSFSKK